jgi:phosphocarrier protein FPr/phosphocarrier protein
MRGSIAQPVSEPENEDFVVHLALGRRETNLPTGLARIVGQVATFAAKEALGGFMTSANDALVSSGVVSTTTTSTSAAPRFWLTAPIAGWATALADVPDPVFSGRILGDGVAIDPSESTLRAPCAGVITTLHRAHHAITLRAANGLELLIHIGLDTVALKGEGFTAHVTEGQTVAAGDKLISFDLEVLANRAPSLLCPVIVTNPDAFAIVSKVEGKAVAAGDNLLELAAQKPGASQPAEPAAGGGEARLDVTLTAPYGIHARPAGLIAQRARGFAGKVTLQAKGRSVSALSAVGIMGLGAGHGDVVSVIAKGADARQAAEAVAELLRSDMGDEPGQAPPAARPAAAAPAPAIPTVALPPFPPDREVTLAGVVAAPGLAVGRAVRLVAQAFDFPEAGAGAAVEQPKLRDALATAQATLRATLAADPDQGSPAHAILSAHLAFLEDPDLLARAEALIGEGKSAGFAWHQAMDEQVVVLRGLGDARLAERANDLVDVERRVLAVLAGPRQEGAALPPDAVLFADDLLPSQLAGVDTGTIAGICTAGGGPTSHVAILAGSMGIPALVAIGPDALRVPDGAPVIVNADEGVVRVFPPAALAGEMQGAMAARRARIAEARLHAQEEGRTADGVRIEVVANLGNVADVKTALANGAEGCGLLRSEFLFLNRDAAPTEDEQAAQYQAIATGLDGRKLIIRTLDAGADKVLPYLAMPMEANPQLGVRGIRLGLAQPALLAAQLRAILRVAPAGQCSIMLPMVASLAELQQARAMLEEAKAKLGRTDSVALGIMIEVPSAALLSEALAAEADFFSVGTNDLTQYVLAMDRLNPALARQVDALHPAVLRLIAATVEGARKHGRWVGVCGALASLPLAAPVLIGLGITELSSAAAAVPQVKAVVRTLTMDACVAAAQEALQQTSAQAVRAVLARRWPDV